MNEGQLFCTTEGMKESAQSLSSMRFWYTGHVIYEALDMLNSFATL